VPLSLPQARTRDGSAETIRDLTSHPWAGAKVRVTLVVKDEAGQEGRSQPAEIVLPSRNFTNPLARAVVEQRGNLALDANAAPDVADGLDALTLAPENIDKTRDYLALRSAYFRLLNARSDDDLRAEVDYLWSIALGIEDGDMSIAEQELRAAQDALRKALESNASDEEIRKLTDQLRQAMQKYLQALAEEMRRNPQSARLPPNPDAKMLRSEDLQKMLDQIEKLAESGARDAAKQMLSQLQNMLENLQAGRPQQGDEASEQMMQSLNDLADMIQKQQKLMDQTFQSDRGQSPDGKPMTRQELEQALKQLQEGQEGLQQQLQSLMDKLQQQGMDPSGKLGQAGEAMGRAAGQLGKGRPGQAVGEQGNALDALRQGAQGLAQQFANRNGQGGGVRGGDQFSNQDPLGRPQRTTGPDLGASVKVPDEIDVQRAREILDAIRRKLGEAGQSPLERDYLERLLERF
jgi:tetratricopeptide (TPR) repeat protein